MQDRKRLVALICLADREARTFPPAPEEIELQALLEMQLLSESQDSTAAGLPNWAQQPTDDLRAAEVTQLIDDRLLHQVAGRRKAPGPAVRDFDVTVVRVVQNLMEAQELLEQLHHKLADGTVTTDQPEVADALRLLPELIANTEKAREQGHTIPNGQMVIAGDRKLMLLPFDTAQKTLQGETQVVEHEVGHAIRQSLVVGGYVGLSYAEADAERSAGRWGTAYLDQRMRFEDIKDVAGVDVVAYLDAPAGTFADAAAMYISLALGTYDNSPGLGLNGLLETMALPPLPVLGELARQGDPTHPLLRINQLLGGNDGISTRLAERERTEGRGTLLDARLAAHAARMQAMPPAERMMWGLERGMYGFQYVTMSAAQVAASAHTREQVAPTAQKPSVNTPYTDRRSSGSVTGPAGGGHQRRGFLNAVVRRGGHRLRGRRRRFPCRREPPCCSRSSTTASTPRRAAG